MTQQMESVTTENGVLVRQRGPAQSETVVPAGRTGPARRTDPSVLMDLTSGVYAFKALALAVDLELFTDLADGAGVTAEEFAARHGVNYRPAELLLVACTSLGLLMRDDAGVYRNTEVSETHLVEGRPYYFGGWVRVVDRHEYGAYQSLERSFRGNHPTTWDVEKQESLFDPSDPVMMDAFWDGMYSLSAYSANQLSSRIDLSDATALLDVGGGGAAFPIELCKAFPHLRASVFDLEFVGPLTVARVEAAGLGDRISFLAGDFFDDALPRGYDVIILSNILHDWNPDDVQKILATCSAALPTGGRLLISEQFVNDEKTGPAQAALMSLNMLVETWGRNYTAAEYSGWASSYGLHSEGVIPVPGFGSNGALVLRKR